MKQPPHVAGKEKMRGENSGEGEGKGEREVGTNSGKG